MDVYQDLVKVSKKLMLRESFYGLYLISLNKKIDKSIPTACVGRDGINLDLRINPEFWSKSTEASRIGILKHELLHIAMFHLDMFSRYSNKKLLNMAADLEINQYISSEYKGEDWVGLELDKSPFKELKLEPFKGTDYYYKKLEEESQNNPNGEMSSEMGAGIGDHDLWEEIEKLPEAEKKLIQKQVEHVLKQTAETVAKGHGNVPGELKDIIGRLNKKTESVIDWKAYLRRFSSRSTKILTKKTRYKSSKRFNPNPALKINPKKSTLVGIDTSASVSNEDLVELFNQINHIHKSGTEVTIVEFDTKINQIYEYEPTKKIEVIGRGGTDFNPIHDYVRKSRGKYNNLIIMSDGEAPAPTNDVLIPVLWVYPRNRRINDKLKGAHIQIK